MAAHEQLGSRAWELGLQLTCSVSITLQLCGLRKSLHIGYLECFLEEVKCRSYMR